MLRLQQAGFAAEALPLIEIAPVADARPLVLAWEKLGDYAACMFVSGNAVDCFFGQKFKEKVAVVPAGNGVSATYSIAGSLPSGLRFLAPGPGTVAALVAAGVDRSRIDAPPADAQQFDSEALWAVVGARDWRSKTIASDHQKQLGVRLINERMHWKDADHFPLAIQLAVPVENLTSLKILSFTFGKNRWVQRKV